MFRKARVFVPSKTFLPSLIFWVRPGASFAIIRLGWKSLTRGNTLAYYEHSKIKAAKILMRLRPGANVIKLFTSVLLIFLAS